MKDYSEALAGDLSAGLVKSLQTMARRLRKHSLTSTAEAGSGHPSSCLSCAELVSTLFFNFFRFDIQNPACPNNDRFVLSKGHAAPVLWAAWAEAGAFPTEQLLNLRKIDSNLEGHPTPRNPLVDVATGSLGQGLSIAVGMALAGRMRKTDNQIYVLLGDGEAAEGSVWEAASLASHYRLANLTAIVDVNRFGQSQTTMHQHDLERHREKFASFGWDTQIIDGHSVEEISAALTTGIANSDQPAAILARTIKGKGVSFMEDRDGWHGKPVQKGEELEKALAEIGDDLDLDQELRVRPPESQPTVPTEPKGTVAEPDYSDQDSVATRQAYGTALQKLGAVNPNVVALDGDTKNSTFSQKFLEMFPERFFECFIAEQNMVGAAIGFSAMKVIPFVSTFACFLTRAYDQIRMGAISQSNINLCGSHAGVSIGQDGPSQMGLEDLAMMRTIVGSTVLYPSDAVCAERLVALAAETPGIVYIRTSRPKTSILYSAQEKFEIGGSKVLHSTTEDQATIIGAGVTLHEALNAYDLLQVHGIAVRIVDLYSVKPLDEETVRAAAQETGVIITVEDHYAEGGLGDAVLGALANESCAFHKLAITDLPRSGPPEALMEMFGINARAIVEAVKKLV